MSGDISQPGDTSPMSDICGPEYEPDEKPTAQSTEETAKFFFEAFKPYLAQDVDWRDLLLTYKHFDIKQIRRLKEIGTQRPEVVVLEIFHEIENSEFSDRFTKLVEAFGECGNTKAVDILKGNVIPTDSHARELIMKKGKTICDRLIPNDIVPALMSRDVIVQKDAAHITNRAASDGGWLANFELLFILPTKSQDWFKKFIEALIEINQDDLAEDINPEYYRAIKQGENGELMSMDNLTSCQPVQTDERVKEVFDEVLKQCYTKFVEDLEPDSFLDKAIDSDLHNLVSSRDIREVKNTSEKNRLIIEHVRKRGFIGYEKFKQCLLLNKQQYLLKVLEAKEQELLTQVYSSKGNVRENVITDYQEASINNLSPYKADDYSSYDSEPAKKSLDFDMLVADEENVTSPESLASMASMSTSGDQQDSLTEDFSCLLSLNDGDQARAAAAAGRDERQQGTNTLTQVPDKTRACRDERQQGTNTQDPDNMQAATGTLRDRPVQAVDLTEATINEMERKLKTLDDVDDDDDKNGVKMKDFDRTEVKRRAIEGNGNIRMKDLDKTEVKRRAIEGDGDSGGARRKENNLTGLRDNSESPVSKELKDKYVFDSCSGTAQGSNMNITEAESVAQENDDEDDVEDEDISLRQYQEELAGPALQGKNVIIVAPTGSGKTRVALRIIQEHIRNQRGQGIAKVIFLVNQVALANQQGAECEKQLPQYKSKVISGESQRAKSECLKDFIDRRDILIVTAQVLLDSLVQREISGISVFSLMVFDECHHTHANHAFNQIMGMYIKQKIDQDQTGLPQIVGLTASVGVGKAKNMDKALAHIKSLMANLDAEVISTVHSNMEELRSYVSLPEEETCTVPKRKNDVFGDNVTKLINMIEQRMTSSSLVKEMPGAAQFEPVLKSPAQKGNAQYTQWVNKLIRETAKLQSQEARRFLIPCRAHLEYYNNALMIHNDARVEDALNYLEIEMSRWKENALMNENEKRLNQAYERLKSAARRDNSANPKLKKLEELILKVYRTERGNDSRGIVFVKTRDLAKAIVSWMKETPGLRELNPIPFLGQNQSSVKGGMTKVEQDDALKYFRDGKHKLIVATSVAEEGLDISKCNLVIRYDHVTNEIAMVQSRGRGRAQDSKYCVIAEQGTGMAEKEELNMIREILMRNAIIKLQEGIIKDPSKFKEEIHKLQIEANLDRKLKGLGRKGKIIRTGEFELRCLRCNQFICMSSDIKKVQNAHHVIIDESIEERVKMQKLEPMKYTDSTTEIGGKQICKQCGDNLGPICIHKGIEFPVAKIEKFLIVDINGRQDLCSRWKSAPFRASDLTHADWQDIITTRGGTD